MYTWLRFSQITLESDALHTNVLKRLQASFQPILRVLVYAIVRCFSFDFYFIRWKMSMQQIYRNCDRNHKFVWRHFKRNSLEATSNHNRKIWFSNDCVKTTKKDQEVIISYRSHLFLCTYYYSLEFYNYICWFNCQTEEPTLLLVDRI